MIIGVANLLPGVSGSTIALLLGVYGRSLEVLSAFRLPAWLLLRKGEWKLLAKTFQIRFFLPLLAGILVSIYVFSYLIHYVYAHYGLLLNALFFGLILTTSLMLWSTFCGRILLWLWLFLGVGIAVAVIFFAQIQQSSDITHHMDDLCRVDAFALFFAGIAASAAMLIPGISGSFVLLMLNQYDAALCAVKQLQIGALTMLACGILLGLLLTARGIAFLWKKFHATTLSLLLGLMLGALPKLWIWQWKGQWLWPHQYQTLTDQNPMTFWAILVFIAGALLAYLLSGYSIQKK